MAVGGNSLLCSEPLLVGQFGRGSRIPMILYDTVNEPMVRASFWRNPKAHIEPSCTAVEHIHKDLKPGQSPAIHTGQTLKAWNQVEQAVAFLLEAKFR